MMTERVKESETRERTKESKEQESNSLSLSTRTREELQAIARSVPSLEMVREYSRTLLGFDDERFIAEWYRQMQMSFWCDEFGNPIRNWGWMFNKWRLNERLFQRLRDPERIADARNGGKKRKADNYRGTRREEVGDVLG